MNQHPIEVHIRIAHLIDVNSGASEVLRDRSIALQEGHGDPADIEKIEDLCWDLDLVASLGRFALNNWDLYVQSCK